MFCPFKQLPPQSSKTHLTLSINHSISVFVRDFRVFRQHQKKKGTMSNLGQKTHERASFVNILSQFLKEKRNLGDFSVGITSKPDSKGVETSRKQAKTMNFLANHVASTSNMKSLDFFPKNFGASSSKEANLNKTDLRKQEAVERKNAQLTIFFNGQVVVYNDFPSDKMKEIMALANQGNNDINKIDQASNSDIPDLNITSATANSPAQNPSVERCQYGGGSDLRIARRNSLHKFFEKRKDRAAAKAPYQLNNQRGSPSVPKPDENKPLYEEGQSSKEAPRDLDLNL